MKAGTPKLVKSKAIAHLLAQFPGEEEFQLDDEEPRKVDMVEVAVEEGIMKFDNSSTAHLRGAGVVLYHKERETITLLFELEFQCSSNTAEYEVYFIGLAVALKIGQHLRVVGDYNLVVYQAMGSFSLREPSLAFYKTLA